MAWTVRPVASLDELARVVAFIEDQIASLVPSDERRFRDLPASYPRYRDLMLVAEDAEVAEAVEAVVGAVLATGPSERPVGEFAVLVKALAVHENHRRLGLGRLLLAQLEHRAAALGAVEIILGAIPSARGFYARAGYSGRSRMHKALTGKGTSRYGSAEERRRRLDMMRARRADRLGK